MPLAYSIALDCVPRVTLGGDELARAVQSLHLARRIEETYRAAGEAHRPDEEKTFTERARRTGGTESGATRNLAELRRETAPVQPLSAHCAECPASLSGQSFGCVQQIAFPVARATEQWLLDQTGPPDTASGQLLRLAIQQMNLGIDCALLAEWRRAGFLEAPFPLRTEHPGDPRPVTGDALFHALFMSGDLSATPLFSILLATRAIETADGGDTDDLLRRVTAFQMAGNRGTLPEFRFRQLPESADPPGILEIKTFLLAAFRAFTLGVPLRLHATA